MTVENACEKKMRGLRGSVWHSAVACMVVQAYVVPSIGVCLYAATFYTSETSILSVDSIGVLIFVVVISLYGCLDKC